MEILTSKSALSKAISELKNKEKRIGFVPTMGALHAGHLSLIEKAKEHSDVIVCSIFVNPTQFNNPRDLERYPRPIETDLELLRNSDCDILFLPDVNEMYTPDETWSFDLGYLEQVLEGKFRAGHYQGVTQIVKKLLDAVTPDLIFLGQKDYQQIMVIESLIKFFAIPTKVIMCPIIREVDGLALSSRNIHLSARERKQALILSKTLFEMRSNYEKLSISELKSAAIKLLSTEPEVVLEYLEICDGETLLETKSKENKSIVALIAAQVGETRLIDNIILK